MLYSYQGAEPAALPHRIRLSDGSTRTDASTFTPPAAPFPDAYFL
jgi:hypothetical protein